MRTDHIKCQFADFFVALWFLAPYLLQHRLTAKQGSEMGLMVVLGDFWLQIKVLHSLKFWLYGQEDKSEDHQRKEFILCGL